MVDKQVALSSETDGALYPLLEAMAEGIRQFSTFEQRLSNHPDRMQMYFAGLEMLRAHLHRVLSQIAAIASIEIPKIPEHMRYDDAWQLEAYTTPMLSPPEGGGMA